MNNFGTLTCAFES